jgi:adenylate cyclase
VSRRANDRDHIQRAVASWNATLRFGARRLAPRASPNGIPGLAGPGYRRTAALAALDLAGAVGDMPVGVAANAGIAFVGNVGSGTVMDFTALGDAVNVGARLQAHASPGQVVLASELYELVANDYPGARSEFMEVRGRDEPVHVAVFTR